MGLLDILNGMQNGPRGQQNPNAPKSGMSPITMAILGLLAYKAVKSFGGQQQTSPMTPGNTAGPGTSPNLTGSLGDLLPGGLGSLLGGAAAGGILSGGLNDLLNKFQQNGLGDIAKSWIGPGTNMPVAATDLEKALGPEQIAALMEHTGLSRSDLLDGLTKNLPQVIDQLTPNGTMPAAHELTL
jgi:uncharacterized protein YidB (DUF937 family)